MSQLGEALFTKTQQKVLGLLYSQPDRSFYTKEILRATGMGVSTIKSELENFLTAGILSMEKIGNQHHYQANAECPIYEELRSIVRKTFGIADVIREALHNVDQEISLAFIYGSIAKAQDTAKSDIDLFVVSNITLEDLMKSLAQAEETLHREINPSIYTKTQIKSRIKQNNSFITRVLEQPKIWIKGDEDGLSAVR